MFKITLLFSLILLLSLVINFSTSTTTTSITGSSSETSVKIEKEIQSKVENIIQKELTKTTLQQQQKDLQNEVKELTTFKRHHGELYSAYKYLDQLESKLKKDLAENCKKVIISKAKYLKIMKIVEEHRRVLKLLQIQLVKHNLSFEKKKKLKEEYAILLEKYKSEMKQAFEIYQTYRKLSCDAYKTYKKERKDIKKQVLLIKLQLRIVHLMKSKLFSTQHIHVQLSHLFQQWKYLVSKVSHVTETHIHNYYYGDNNDEDDRCNCVVVFKPVCGMNGISYNSACTARCAKVPIAYEGPCQCLPNVSILKKKTSDNKKKKEEEKKIFEDDAGPGVVVA
ncbi:hypothetical protein ABK040_001555 [Willaertia magna]